MGKNKGNVVSSASTNGKGSGSSITSAKKNDASDSVDFPKIASTSSGKTKARTLGEPEVLMPDQVLLYDNALTSKECDAIVAMFAPEHGATSGIAMQPSPPAKKGEARRTNARFSTVSPAYAEQLYELTGIKEAVKDWPSIFERSDSQPKGLSSNIRVYRYDPGDIFACHYDDHSTDPHFGSAYGKTEWTLLIYLSGEPEVEGGQTVFYKTHTRPKEGVNASDKAVVAPLRKGAALLHRHGKVCMLHEALPPTKGTKWVLRSDLIFGAT